MICNFLMFNPQNMNISIRKRGMFENFYDICNFDSFDSEYFYITCVVGTKKIKARLLCAQTAQRTQICRCNPNIFFKSLHMRRRLFFKVNLLCYVGITNTHLGNTFLFIRRINE